MDEPALVQVCVVDTPKMVVISAGGAHSLCLDSSGAAYSFGLYTLNPEP